MGNKAPKRKVNKRFFTKWFLLVSVLLLLFCVTASLIVTLATNFNCVTQQHNCSTNYSAITISFLQQEDTSTIATAFSTHCDKGQKIAILNDLLRIDSEISEAFYQMITTGNQTLMQELTGIKDKRMAVLEKLIGQGEQRMSVLEKLAGEGTQRMPVIKRLLGIDDAEKINKIITLLSEISEVYTVMAQLLEKYLGLEFKEKFRSQLDEEVKQRLGNKYNEFTKFVGNETWYITSDNWDAVPMALLYTTPLTVEVFENVKSDTAPEGTLTAVAQLGGRLQWLKLHLWRQYYYPDASVAILGEKLLQRVIDSHR